MSDYDHELQDALSKAAKALGSDSGTRSESIAERIIAIRTERDKALKEVRRLRYNLLKLRHGTYTTAPGQTRIDRILRDSENQL